jgi:two-component system response regulator HydG
MRQVAALATRAAHVDSTVLITGESGVGKERLARFIHEASRRRDHPFLAINCGSLPEALIESELFGHTRGAFTGALRDRTGLFEAADRSTLLLDEIGDVPLWIQVKLLRVLQEREVRRVGDNQTRRVNVRVIAATNRDLKADVANGRFRGDLYYRLRVIELHIPPLRERPDDLRRLAESLLLTIGSRMRRPIGRYTTTALECILAYGWPGNIRELENVVERACALATGNVIDIDDLPDEVRHHHAVVVASEHVRPLRDIEREYILAALERNHGSRTATAEQLRIGLATLRRKLKSYAKTG